MLPYGLLVTVVVVNWNRRALLEACLHSLETPQGAAFETVVVDNGSTDGSADFVDAYALDSAYPLRLIRNPDNRGFCAANNQAIAAARTPFIALLNNDAEAEPGFLAHLLAAFEQGDDVGMAAAKILVWEDPRVIDKAGHLIYPDGQNRGRGSGELDTGQFDQIEDVLWPDGAAAMYRKSMLDEIGGFDGDLFAYADDAELGLRARIAGWRCLYMPRAVVRHHRGATLGQTSFARIRLIERNRVLLAAKLFPGSLLWQNAGYYLARLIAGARASVAGQGEAGRFPTPRLRLQLLWTMIRGDLEALWMAPRMIRKRTGINRIRKLAPREVKRLILSHRISLNDLSRRSALPL